VEETDRVISVSECTAHQFKEVYGYEGPVEVVRYHNLPLFDEPVPLPDGPPWRIGYMGRLSIEQKNLDTLLRAFSLLREDGMDAELHFHGDGPDKAELADLASRLGVEASVTLHGWYDHRKDLPGIMADNHVFTYISNYEGGPCFTLLELLQAGRYVVASPVGGIPDIYDGHPRIGSLVEASDAVSVSDSLKEGLEKIREGFVDPEVIRKRYRESFSMECAHREWVRAVRA
jgi:glycosyltransferase involved in cell wall biosynthesis